MVSFLSARHGVGVGCRVALSFVDVSENLRISSDLSTKLKSKVLMDAIQKLQPHFSTLLLPRSAFVRSRLTHLPVAACRQTNQVVD